MADVFGCMDDGAAGVRVGHRGTGGRRVNRSQTGLQGELQRLGLQTTVFPAAGSRSWRLQGRRARKRRRYSLPTVRVRLKLNCELDLSGPPAGGERKRPEEPFSDADPPESEHAGPPLLSGAREAVRRQTGCRDCSQTNFGTIFVC